MVDSGHDETADQKNKIVISKISLLFAEIESAAYCCCKEGVKEDDNWQVTMNPTKNNMIPGRNGERHLTCAMVV
jgi:hypothetical protein